MKASLEKLRFWVYLRLLKIYYWAQRSAFKKALALRNLSVRILDSEVRLLEPTLLQVGERDGDDEVVEYVCRYLTQRQMILEIENAAHLRSEMATELIARCKQSKEVCEVIATYFLAEAFTSSLLKDSEREEINIKNARQFVPDAQSLKVDATYKLHSKLKRRYYVIRSELAERSAIKIDFQVSSLISLIGVVSALFVLSGYLCTSIFLGTFGVDVSLYFSLPDYLAVSIEQIRHAAIPTSIALAVFVFGLREGSMKSRMMIRLQREERAREGKWILAFVIILSIHVAWGLYNDTPSFPEMLILATIASYWFADQVAYMFFSRPLPVLVFLVALFIFVSNTGVTLFQQIHDLKAGKWGNRDSVKLTLITPLPVASDSLVMIAANNNYVFALSKTNKIAYAIPRENIQLIETEWEKLKGPGSE